MAIKLDSAPKRLGLFGPSDSHLRLLRKSFEVRLTARQDKVIITGQDSAVAGAAEVIDRMQKHLLKHESLSATEVSSLIDLSKQPAKPATGQTVTVFSKKKAIEPNTGGQAKYVEAMLNNDLTF